MLKEDIITCKSYIGLCDYVYDAPNLDDIPEGGIVHVHLDQIHEFFKRIRGNGRDYIIVSSSSDYGLALQEEYPVWRDLAKWVPMVANPSIGYQSINMPPRCNIDLCKETDRFSIRCYSWTKSTFNTIPENVRHWFVTNLLIPADSRPDFITPIPFGINPDSLDNLLRVMEENVHKDKWIYASWKDYTYDRYVLRKRIKDQFCHDVISLRSGDVPHLEYLREMAAHRYVLCPAGNGLDCYRNLEAIYLKCIPIIPNELGLVYPTAESFNTDLLNWRILNEEWLRTHILAAEAKSEYNIEQNYKYRLSYWKNRFLTEKIYARQKHI